jgi:peptide/nickel transport system permease protein
MGFGNFQLVILTTDVLLFLLVACVLLFIWNGSRRDYYVTAWRQIRSRRIPMVCLGILLIYVSVALLDSIHYQARAVTTDGSLQTNDAGEAVYESEILSLLDMACSGLRARTEKTFSAPFATRQFTKELIEQNGVQVRDYPSLTYGGQHLTSIDDRRWDILSNGFTGLFNGLWYALMIMGAYFITTGIRAKQIDDYERSEHVLNTVLFIAGIVVVACILAALSGKYHVFGTDQIGKDVLYRSLKGCRVGLVIGTLTTLIATPVAILFGITAGYFGGWIDDLIQYVYTTLSSIPNILLITAVMLIVTTRVSGDQTTIAADNRLVWLCVVLGVGSWTGLCRLLRGETLKVREQEYIQASEAFGVSRFKIMFRHILPNVLHIVLITMILRFSGLVLAEAVLAYVGIGVDPTMESWGNMINAARQEVARDPIVWWNLSAAFLFMIGLVLPANIFGDAVRDALDPRLRTE